MPKLKKKKKQFCGYELENRLKLFFLVDKIATISFCNQFLSNKSSILSTYPFFLRCIDTRNAMEYTEKKQQQKNTAANDPIYHRQHKQKRTRENQTLN